MANSLAFKPTFRTLIPYLIGPVLLNLFVIVIPLAGAVYYSVHSTFNYELTFVGLKNYSELLSDEIFWFSLRNNIIIIVLSGFVQIGLGFVIAFAMVSSYIQWKRVIQAVFFLPVVLSPLVVSYLWQLILSSRNGMLNVILEAIGLEVLQRNWLADPDIVVFAICVPLTWQFTGLYMVIFLAGLTGIPKEILDCAEIDGANGFRRAIHIVIPLLKSTFNVTLLLVLAGGVRIFEQIYAMTGGGPGYSSMVLAQYAYTVGFGQNNHGYGSAIAIEMLLISFILIGVATKLVGGTKQNEY
jgi:raffinose/stachyose/melibiose transport system permease protein